MTCNCIERIEKELVESFNKGNRYGKKVTALSIQEKALMISSDLSNGKTLTHSTLKITLENGKWKTENLVHNFCPFCGKPEIEVNQAEKICCYCKKNPGCKPGNPHVWNGFLDKETNQLVCFACQKEHYRIKSENGTKGFSISEFPVQINQ